MINADIRAAIEADQYAAAGALILKGKAESRGHVGLPPDTDLTPLQVAAYYDPEAAALLLQRGAVCDLHSACALGRIDDIRRLGNPQAFGVLAEHLTPMGFAVTRGQHDAMAALLDAGDEADRPLPRIGFFVWELHVLNQGLQGWTPLHAASAHGYLANAPDLIRLLVDYGADLHRVSCLGEAPIHLAATFRWTRSVDVLLELGADINGRTVPIPVEIHHYASPPGTPVVHDQTPLMIAVREGQTAVVEQLLASGADLHASDSNGATALHIAARPWWKEDPAIAELLLDAGADPNTGDNTALLPVDYAQSASHVDTVRLLRGAG